jgi:hypothetical protein
MSGSEFFEPALPASDLRNAAAARQQLACSINFPEVDAKADQAPHDWMPWGIQQQIRRF